MSRTMGGARAAECTCQRARAPLRITAPAPHQLARLPRPPRRCRQTEDDCWARSQGAWPQATTRTRWPAPPQGCVARRCRARRRRHARATSRALLAALRHCAGPAAQAPRLLPLLLLGLGVPITAWAPPSACAAARSSSHADPRVSAPLCASHSRVPQVGYIGTAAAGLGQRLVEGHDVGQVVDGSLAESDRQAKQLAPARESRAEKGGGIASAFPPRAGHTHLKLNGNKHAAHTCCGAVQSMCLQAAS